MQKSAIEHAQAADQNVPLVVDLDGTLIKTDLLVETAFSFFGQDPTRAGSLIGMLFRGKAAFKAYIAAATDINAALLPYDERVIDLIQQARSAGRPVYIASASNERYVNAVAGHLGLFDGWFASTATENLSASAKAQRLVEAFGPAGFDYIGNGTADLAVWSKSRKRIAVQPSSAVEGKLLALDPSAVILRRDGFPMRYWAKLLRVHQWAKNGLVFVPLVTSQSFDLVSLGQALMAFVAFSLAASGIYLINDLVDLDADRNHRSKKHRPLAAGTIPVLDAIIVAPLLVAIAVLGSFLLNPWFGAALLAYIALSTSYTFVLKRKMMIDLITLAVLYTLRVVGGAAAIAVPVSEWLLAFSLFLFFSLALIKRYTELAVRLDANLPNPTNRNYRKIDLDVIAALAAASGLNAITVFTLYISSDNVRQMHSHPKVLWLICPILMYWIGRILMLAHRRELNDDPIVFALKDVNSLACGAAIAVIFWLSATGIPFDVSGFR